MNGFSELFDGPPESWPERIVFTSDRSEPPRWHVRDQDARILALPLCPVAPAERTGLAPVALAMHAATLWLPEGATSAEYGGDAGSDDSPSTGGPAAIASAHIEGWDWSDEESLHVTVGTSPELPALSSRRVYGPEDCRADVAGRPMRVVRYAESDEAGRVRHRAMVDGHLDHTHEFCAYIYAETAEARDALLACLLTLTPTVAAPAGEASHEIGARGA